MFARENKRHKSRRKGKEGVSEVDAMLGTDRVAK